MGVVIGTDGAVGYSAHLDDLGHGWLSGHDVVLLPAYAGFAISCGPRRSIMGDGVAAGGRRDSSRDCVPDLGCWLAAR